MQINVQQKLVHTWRPTIMNYSVLEELSKKQPGKSAYTVRCGKALFTRNVKNFVSRECFCLFKQTFDDKKIST